MNRNINFKLGGWHRLWLVLSVLYLIPIVFIVHDEFPTQADVDYRTVHSLMNPDLKKYILVTKRYDQNLSDTAVSGDFLIKITEGEYNVEIRLPKDLQKKSSVPDRLNKAWTQGYSWQEAMEYIKENPDTSANSSDQKIIEIINNYRNASLAALKQKRMSVILNYFLAWFFPIIALYLFSWSIGWIFRGFKGSKDLSMPDARLRGHDGVEKVGTVQK